MGTVSWTAGTGPLAPFADGFRQELLALPIHGDLGGVCVGTEKGAPDLGE
jgi:hypothetical protein